MRVGCASPMLTAAPTSHRARKYIDDSAEVDHDAESELVIALKVVILTISMIVHEIEDDPDSYEAQVRQADQQDFPMAPILAGHEDRLRAAAPYRVPSPLWQSRTPDPPTPNAPLFLPGSRDPTPFASYGWLQNPSMLRDPTPTAYPPPDLRPQLPVLRQYSPGPSPADLFAPGASFLRDPTPQPSPQPDPQPQSLLSKAQNTKRARDDDDEEAANPRPKKRASASAYLDLAAEESGDEEEDDEEDLEESVSDIGAVLLAMLIFWHIVTNVLHSLEFLDDDEPQEDFSRPQARANASTEHEEALALAASYSARVKDYQNDLEREETSTLTAVQFARATHAPPAKSKSRRKLPRKPRQVVPGTWVRPRKKPAKEELVFVISSTALLYMPSNPSIAERFREENNFKFPRRWGYALLRKNNKLWTTREVEIIPNPSRSELAAYMTCTSKHLLGLPRNTPTCDFTEIGTRVAVIDGNHQGCSGVIMDLTRVQPLPDDDGSLVRLGQKPAKPGQYACLARMEGDTFSPLRFDVYLANLRRHFLEVYPDILVGDRVRVVGGFLYLDTVGHVTEVIEVDRTLVDGEEIPDDPFGVEYDNTPTTTTRDIMITIAVPDELEVIGPTEPSSHWAGVKTFNVAIGLVRREFHLGDMVERSKDRRVGTIVGIEPFSKFRVVDLISGEFDQVCWSFLILQLLTIVTQMIIYSPDLNFYHESTDLLPLISASRPEPSAEPQIGDVVRVKRGKYLSRSGTIVALHDPDILELRDVTSPSTLVTF